MIETDYNRARFEPGNWRGHYESYFQRANHPTRPLAFWIRYTVFSPRARPERAIAELWAMFFNGETGRHVAVKRELPVAQSEFQRDRFAVRVGSATLDGQGLSGAAESAGRSMEWVLRYAGTQPPVLTLPKEKYDGGFPKAKLVVGVPMAEYNGRLRVDGMEIPVERWVGSQNHNWGSEHTNRYAYGQVCGFDNAPDSFLEMASARVKIGPLPIPMVTPIVLRHGGREWALNTLGQGLRAKARYGYFDWRFRSENEAVRIEGRIHADKGDFVGLRYYNPPGGDKFCLNSKIAACELRLTDKASGRSETLSTARRAAFEILTDDLDHGVEIRA
ncbi:MAG: hypothetical protein HYV18_05350 [Gammaproteobacteria bacterium]|nr:hypothetical protein [Gammaproteobacteria bacterium]